MLLMLGDLSLRRTGTNGCEDSVVIRYQVQDDFDDHGHSRHNFDNLTTEINALDCNGSEKVSSGRSSTSRWW